MSRVGFERVLLNIFQGFHTATCGCEGTLSSLCHPAKFMIIAVQEITHNESIIQVINIENKLITALWTFCWTLKHLWVMRRNQGEVEGLLILTPWKNKMFWASLGQMVHLRVGCWWPRVTVGEGTHAFSILQLKWSRFIHSMSIYGKPGLVMNFLVFKPLKNKTNSRDRCLWYIKCPVMIWAQYHGSSQRCFMIDLPTHLQSGLGLPVTSRSLFLIIWSIPFRSLMIMAHVSPLPYAHHVDLSLIPATLVLVTFYLNRCREKTSPPEQWEMECMPLSLREAVLNWAEFQLLSPHLTLLSTGRGTLQPLSIYNLLLFPASWVESLTAYICLSQGILLCFCSPRKPTSHLIIPSHTL